MILLVVDAQEQIVTEKLYQYDKFMTNVKLLIHTARNNNIEVIYTRHNDGVELTKGMDGFDICKAFEPMASEKILDKHYNSVFRDTGLPEYLLDKKENTIMIVGLQTEYCIDASIKCGFEHSFHMMVPAYCNSTFDNEYMTAEQSYEYYNHKIWNKRYSTCVSFEEAVAYLKK